MQKKTYLVLISSFLFQLTGTLRAEDPKSCAESIEAAYNRKIEAYEARGKTGNRPRGIVWSKLSEGLQSKFKNANPKDELSILIAVNFSEYNRRLEASRRSRFPRNSSAQAESTLKTRLEKDGFKGVMYFPSEPNKGYFLATGSLDKLNKILELQSIVMTYNFMDVPVDEISNEKLREIRRARQ